MNNDKYLYVGGGYNSNGLSWWLPIFFEYCKQKKIKKLLFEKKDISPILTSNEYFKKKFSEFEIDYLEDLLPFWAKSKYLISLKSAIKALIFFILSFFNYHRFSNSFYKETIIAIMDKSKKDGDTTTLKRKNFLIFKSCFIAGYYFWLGSFLSKKAHSCVLVHSVYHNRFTVMILKKKKIPTFHVNMFNIHRQSNGITDFSWKALNLKVYSKLKKLVNKREVINYWTQRISGKSKYDIANIANIGTIGTQHKYKTNLNSNFIFLHVFKDTPYSWFKNYKDQIFKDYTHWILKTIEIIKHSNEDWFIKTHPISQMYGENKIELREDIKSRIKYYKNIKILEEDIPNTLILEQCKRMVTYSSHSSLEYAAYGKKPIIVYPNILSERIKEAVFLPKNYSQYSKLLLENPNSKLSAKEILKVKELIYIMDCVLFSQNDVGGKRIFMNSKKQFNNEDIRCILSHLPKNRKYYEMYGKMLASNKSPLGVSKKYLEKFLNI
jgi:hypothetical protein